MHWSGKLFAWLLVPLVLVAMLFTAKLIKVRNSWTAKIEKSKDEYNKLAPQLVAAQHDLDRTWGDWHRATVTWGQRVYQAQTNVNPAAGSVNVSLGTSQGIQQGQWLYGFEILPDGSSIYRGDFVAQTVREGESLLVPNWRLRAGDTDGWQTGNWRWRLMLPAAYPNRFDELEQTLVQEDELFNDRTQTLAIQQQLIATANEQLKLREAELVGGPELPKTETLDPEFRDGLTATLEALEEDRNAELVRIDRLRRSVRSLNQQVQQTQTENRELVNRLPQPPEQVSQKR